MDLQKTLNQFYHDATLNELRLMNQNTLYPNISYNSLLYLDLIFCREGCTVSYLADALHISKPAVTAKVNELMAQGLVKKVQSTKDKRINYLSLAEDVHSDFLKYDKRLDNAIRLIEQTYSKEQIALFTHILDDIRKEYMKDL